MWHQGGPPSPELEKRAPPVKGAPMELSARCPIPAASQNRIWIWRKSSLGAQVSSRSKGMGHWSAVPLPSRPALYNKSATMASVGINLQRSSRPLLLQSLRPSLTHPSLPLPPYLPARAHCQQTPSHVTSQKIRTSLAPRRALSLGCIPKCALCDGHGLRTHSTRPGPPGVVPLGSGGATWRPVQVLGGRELQPQHSEQDGEDRGRPLHGHPAQGEPLLHQAVPA